MLHEVDPENDSTRLIRQKQGQRIRKFRTLRGLTIQQFADQVGVSYAAVAQWEVGTFTPRQAKQRKIAQILDVPWSAVFGIDEAA